MTDPTGFFQDPPELKNTYSSHRWLKSYLRWVLPKEMQTEVSKDLERFGALCAADWARLGRQAETEKPVHVPFGPWGRRIDEIRTSSAWVELEKIAARECLVGMAYKRDYAEYSRIIQFVKLFLFHPSSGFFTCPLAMADGAAKVLETYGKTEFHKEAFEHLTSRDPNQFWTSGQWMTERPGGSDVSHSETLATEVNGLYELSGTKWFSSATTSQMALALARIVENGVPSQALTLFIVKMRNQDGQLNGIEVLRLKDKLGTWGLPTAELKLQGCVAEPVGEIGRGVKTVASMLNITRLYNSVCSVGQMTRGLELMRSYSGKREAFGLKLEQHVLHYQTFALEEVKTLAGFLLTMELVRILGAEENKKATESESVLLRLLTPVSKLFTAKACIQSASEVIEGFGGAGYVEDTGIPTLLRDSQVFPIWEGATNVLCHDILRVASKSDAMIVLAEWLKSQSISPDIGVAGEALKLKIDRLVEFIQELIKAPAEVQTASMRDFAFGLAWTIGSLRLAAWIKDQGLKEMKPWLEVMVDQVPTVDIKEKADLSRVQEIWKTQLNN